MPLKDGAVMAQRGTIWWVTCGRAQAGAWLWVAMLCGGCSTPTAEPDRGCSIESGAAPGAAQGAAVYIGSRVMPGPGLQAGRRADCADGPLAKGLHGRVMAILARVPDGVRPGAVRVHLTPGLAQGATAIAGLEYHRPSGSLLAGPAAAALPDTVWLHELAHVAMGWRDRGSGGLQGAFRDALEEGIADYYAAAVSGQPILGPFDSSPGGRRDLSDAPAVSPGDWESIALPNVPFDSHRVGWAFGASAWRIQPRVGPLLSDLLACGHAGEGSAPTPGAWSSTCPRRSRDRIDGLLRAWMPAELLR